MNDEWHNITAVGDLWEVQLEAYSSRYRYRQKGAADWISGQPPTGVHAK